jgi:hypothetical protein
MCVLATVSTPAWVMHTAFVLRTHVPLASLAVCLGSTHRDCCPSGPRDETQVAEGVVHSIEGSAVAFHQLALEWTGLEFESLARRQ